MAADFDCPTRVLSHFPCVVTRTWINAGHTGGQVRKACSFNREESYCPQWRNSRGRNFSLARCLTLLGQLPPLLDCATPKNAWLCICGKPRDDFHRTSVDLLRVMSPMVVVMGTCCNDQLWDTTKMSRYVSGTPDFFLSPAIMTTISLRRHARRTVVLYNRKGTRPLEAREEHAQGHTRCTHS